MMFDYVKPRSVFINKHVLIFNLDQGFAKPESIKFFMPEIILISCFFSPNQCRKSTNGYRCVKPVEPEALKFCQANCYL